MEDDKNIKFIETSLDLASRLALEMMNFSKELRANSDYRLSADGAVFAAFVLAYTTYRANGGKEQSKDDFMNIASHIYEIMVKKVDNGQVKLMETPGALGKN